MTGSTYHHFIRHLSSVRSFSSIPGRFRAENVRLLEFSMAFFVHEIQKTSFGSLFFPKIIADRFLELKTIFVLR